MWSSNFLGEVFDLYDKLAIYRNSKAGFVLGTHTVLNERNMKIKAIKKKKYYKTGRKNEKKIASHFFKLQIG